MMAISVLSPVVAGIGFATFFGVAYTYDNEDPTTALMILLLGCVLCVACIVADMIYETTTKKGPQQ